VSRAGYSVVTAAAVALAAATPKSVLGIKSAADFGLDIKGCDVGFDGVTASAVPVELELCVCTFATNSPGTNSTSRTPAQPYGRQMAHGITAASNWTAEPTALTVLKEGLLTPAGGVIWYDWPEGRTYDCDLGNGFVLRCTAPAIVNIRASFDYERN